MGDRWNPFNYDYTPIQNPAARAAVAVALLPLVAVYWIVVAIHAGLQLLLEKLWS